MSVADVVYAADDVTIQYLSKIRTLARVLMPGELLGLVLLCYLGGGAAKMHLDCRLGEHRADVDFRAKERETTRELLRNNILVRIGLVLLR
jgi:hypothetical protein